MGRGIAGDTFRCRAQNFYIAPQYRSAQYPGRERHGRQQARLSRTLESAGPTTGRDRAPAAELI